MLHSIYKNSCDAAERYIEYLLQEGYELVTLSELFYYKGFEPKFDEVYRDGFGNTSKK